MQKPDTAPVDRDGDQEAPAQAAVASVAQPQAGRERSGQAPLSALLAERERRQAAERELSILRDRLGGAPQGDQTSIATLSDRFRASETRLRAHAGDQLADQIETWASARMTQDAAFAKAVLSHADPYAFVADVYARSLRQEPDAEPATALHHQPPPAPPRRNNDRPTPPRSLVSAPSAGGGAHIPQGPGQAFDALFKG
jgi:hypothetical protein